jgi:prepilin-type N-terminal cleavage/methylation domain-containing protein
MKNAKGFTLIELLVVVFIIGILVLIALPKYNKAVWNSRTSELKMMLKNVHTAEQEYELANGEFTNQFSKLGISFDSLSYKSSIVENNNADSVKTNDWYELGLATYLGLTWAYAVFTKGKFKGNGFVIFFNANGHPNDIIMCTRYWRYADTNFCPNQIGTGPNPSGVFSTWWPYYPLP